MLIAKKQLSLYTLVIIIGYTIISCTKNENTPLNNCYSDITGSEYSSDSTSVFPLGTKNFWIYDDSVFSNGTLTRTNPNYLLCTQKHILVNNTHNAITFNQLINTLTIINDTLYFANLKSQYGAECISYEPFLFHTDSRIILDTIQNIVLYPQDGTIPTKLGYLTYNYVYEYSESLKYYINSRIGIIRYESFVDDNLRRSHTLNNYHLEH